MKGTYSLLSAIAVSALLLASFAFVAYSPAGGDTLGDPIDYGAEGYIPISSQSDLARIGTGDEYPSDSGIYWTLDAYYYLTGDVTLGEPHTPIASYTYPFTGIFDGNGHSIIGMNVDVAGNGYTYGGLFAAVREAEIRNLALIDGSVAASSEDILDWHGAYPSAGGIAGYAALTTISNCYNSCSVYAGASSAAGYAHAYAGGIVGYGVGVAIENCTNEGQVSAESTNTTVYWTFAHAGGIAGEIAAYIVPEVVTVNSEIDGCHNSGSVSGAAFTDAEMNVYAGGIAGSMGDTDVKGCSNEGSVEAAAQFAFAGGIAGATAVVTIEDCSNAGAVYADAGSRTQNMVAHAGGIAALIDTTSIIGCYNAGAVTAEAGGNADAGGIVGSSVYGTELTITACYNTGEVVCAAYEWGSAGGVIGSLSSGRISQCYNAGAVSSTTAIANSGGILGSGSYALITDCYNIGAIEGECSENGVAYVGGMAGGVYDMAFANCYSTGTLNGSGHEAYIGGTVGRAAGNGWDISTVTNCYFLEGTADRNCGMQDPLTDGDDPANSDPLRKDAPNQFSGPKSADDMRPAQDDAAAGDSIYYTGVTTVAPLNEDFVQMDLVSVGGWDFENVWIIIPEENDGYPILRSLYRAPDDGDDGDDGDDDTGDGDDDTGGGDDDTGDGDDETGDGDDTGGGDKKKVTDDTGKKRSYALIVMFIACLTVLLLIFGGLSSRKK